ncbi:MAG: phosphoribosylformylglycinamidine cyclo-ligase [Coriobacteriia bacterium]|nr:phosphoribosylformylglycinamidine cyclo-ligase [Coriobacteriia bacterium]MCL2745498.1 phosphoribosylformylglycinamidine cyclo-ligase [Coriobacteriia bacterium]MCL2871189.1 phosphoribosylformylglycinamidine cyclo-ligase [Coriobacteriia bacterium]
MSSEDTTQASQNNTSSKESISGGLTYAEVGVDTAEGARAVDAIRASVQSTYRPEVIGDIGGFGGLFSAAALKDMDDPVLVSGADGVGTKIELARQLGIYDTVGVDLVAMCVNDVLVTGAEPLYFLDYIATGKIESARMEQLVEGIAEGCRQAGCSLIGGEMAEHPGVMADDALDMSGFCTAVVDKPRIVDGSGIQPADLIFGLPSSGFHSNGYSLIRRVLKEKDCNLDNPFSDDNDVTLGQALLEPTRIYVKTILSLLRNAVSIKGMAHITGGGITENLDRILPDGTDAVLRLDSWDIPAAIEYICELASLDQREALRTFNCGIGFMLVVSPKDVPHLRHALDAAGENYFEVGTIEAAEGKGRSVRYI